MKFIKLRYMAYVFSASLILISFLSFFLKGFNFGIDFTGGVLVQVKFQKDVDIKDIRASLQKEDLQSTVIQRIGESKENMYVIKTKASSGDVDAIAVIQQNLLKTFGAENVEQPFERSESVGPTIGKDLRRAAYILIFISLIAMLIYISLRFRFKYALGGIIALGHDVTITLGAFSLFQLEVDMTIVAAVLTIIGYSINDTIVVYDRIRENLRLLRDKPLGEVIDISITTTLPRTIITSLTVLLVVVILFLWGGPVIHNFAFAFILGVVFGTYSSVFVATPIVYDWEMMEESRKHRK